MTQQSSSRSVENALTRAYAKRVGGGTWTQPRPVRLDPSGAVSWGRFSEPACGCLIETGSVRSRGVASVSKWFAVQVR